MSRAVKRTIPLDEARIVLGTGRSGTTWLMGLVANDPCTLPLFEPLAVGVRPADIEPDGIFITASRHEPSPRLEQYLRDVLTGKVTDAWILRDASLRQVLSGKRVVAKLIRACGAAGWLETTFPSVPIVGTVRHPCAVVASMRSAKGRWRVVPDDFVRRHARAIVGDRADPLFGSDASDDIRRFATLWAVDNLALVRDTTASRTALVGFEELVSAPMAELERIAAHLDLPLELGRIDPSRASSTSGPRREPATADRLGAWRDQLTAGEIDTILGIARELGISGFTADPLPDMDAFRALRSS